MMVESRYVVRRRMRADMKKLGRRLPDDFKPEPEDYDLAALDLWPDGEVPVQEAAVRFQEVLERAWARAIHRLAWPQ